MTKDQFITHWFSNVDVPGATRTEDGVRFPDGHEWHAVECRCGEEGCQGWGMVQELPERARPYLRDEYMRRIFSKYWWWPPELGERINPGPED